MNMTDQKSSGFTLLEVLVALIVVALCTTALLPPTVASARRADLALQQNRAMILARSQLDAFAAHPSTLIGVVGGNEGGLEWKIVASDPNSQRAWREDDFGVALRTLRITVVAMNDQVSLVDVSVTRLVQLP